MQARRYRGGREAEQARRLVPVEVEHDPEGDDLALAGCELEQSRVELGREPLERLVRRVARLGRPRSLLAPSPCGCRRGTGPSAVERAIARSQVRAVPRYRVELPPPAKRGLERLAGEILGERSVLREVEEVAVDVVEERLGDGGERRGPIARPVSCVGASMSRHARRIYAADRVRRHKVIAHALETVCCTGLIASADRIGSGASIQGAGVCAASKSDSQRARSSWSWSRAARCAARTSMFVQSSASLRSSSATRASASAILASVSSRSVGAAFGSRRGRGSCASGFSFGWLSPSGRPTSVRAGGRPSRRRTSGASGPRPR